jgi:hypothetical protein
LSTSRDERLPLEHLFDYTRSVTETLLERAHRHLMAVR